jgi:hypothetical protein
MPKEVKMEWASHEDFLDYVRQCKRELEADIPRIEAEIKSLEANIDKLRSRISKFDLVLGISEEFAQACGPETDAQDMSRGPQEGSQRDLLLTALATAGKAMHIDELAQMLAKSDRGREIPRDSISKQLSRMVKIGEVERVAAATYRLARAGASSSPR